MQARLNGHSLLLTHSGLQLGGAPKNPGKHEHEGDSLDTLHWELGPHGEGRQGFVDTGITVSSESQNYQNISLN